MLVLPVPTGLLGPRDDLAAILTAAGDFRGGDILVVSSKAIATVEGNLRDLRRFKPGKDALALAPASGQNPAFTECVLRETRRLNGRVVGTCPFALLTSLKPAGLKKGRILCPNAGLDQSNVRCGFAVGWPENPVESAVRLRKEIMENLKRNRTMMKSTKTKRITRNTVIDDSSLSSGSSSSSIAIIISDSCCRPARIGVTAFALVCAGMDPLRSEVGKTDLFRKPLRFTQEAVADQLATAANAVMGNAGQSIPAAIIRDHGIPPSDFCGWVPGIEPEEDLFREAFLG